MSLFKGTKLILAASLATAAATAGYADPDKDAKLVVASDAGDVEIATVAPAPEFLKGVFDEVYSGWAFRTKETQAMQTDDFDNPGMVFVDKGVDLWNAVDGTEGKSCASCHEGIDSMAGVRASMPKMNVAGDDLWSMENFVNDCRVNRMGAEEWKWNSNEMKFLTAAISIQSRGMAQTIQIDGPAQSWWDKGKEIYYTRYGQLELSCANCHEDSMGSYIRADHLSQGQINGFPTYRTGDATIISAHQRFVGCIRDTRAEPFKPGSEEFRALELYVASRGMTLPVEGVAVRQ
jgi:sulfur-oxidizing protein SoxA